MIELLLVAERLLAEGDLERAGHLFAQVAEADPRNAIAVAGLAQVAHRKGDREGALAHAHRALEIDPDEAAARRLIDELESDAATLAAPAAPAAPTVSAVPAAPTAPAVPAAPTASAAPTGPATAPRRSFLHRILALFGLRH